MSHKQYTFHFEEYDSVEELAAGDAALLKEARAVTEIAYAPYSSFKVGAVARLANGEKVIGSNQENASYPVGICAERVLLSAASALHPAVPVDTIAISYHNLHGSSDAPVSPCGLCRQSLLEHETRFSHPVRIILSGMEGKVLVIPAASMLLPLSFTGENMK